MKYPLKLQAVLFVIIAILPALARAQALADRVPDDAIVYIGWSGTDSPAPAYAQSHLKAILDNTKIRELFTQFLPQVAEKIISKNPEAEKPLHSIEALAGPLLKYPSAFFFSGIELTGQGQPPIPHVGVMCQAGTDAARVKQQLDELLREMPEQPPFPIDVTEKDGVVALLIGYDDPAKALAGAGRGAIGQAAAFTAAMKQVQSAPVLVGYVDLEKVIALVESIVQQQGDEQAKVMLPKVLDASGLRGLKRVIHSAGFDGADWMGMTFVEAPAPRKGMLELLDAKPISPDLLKAVPADATFAAAGRFDPARIITQVKKVLGEIDPQLPGFVDKGLGGVQLALAKNLQTDILEPLGSDWAAYCSPTVAGNGILGMTIVNKLDDPAKAQASLPTASVNLSNWIAVMLSKSNAEVEIRVRNTKVGDQTVYYFGLPIAAPSWTMKDGYLYLGLYPQSAAAGARSTARGGKPISENERFLAVQKRLGVKDACAFSFFDLQATAAQGSTYQQLMLIARYAGFGDLFGVPLPEPLIPTLDVLQQHLAPAGSATWIDDAGIHEKSVSPFPGSKMLSEPGMVSSAGAGGSALMASILLPALNRARETANRVKSASNLRMIGQGMFLYSNDNGGNFPPDLGTVAKTQDLPLEAFVSPRTGSELPKNWRAMSPDQRAGWVNEHADYVYLGNGMTNQENAETVVAYENPGRKLSDGINLLFADGHVEFMLMKDAMDLIEKQKR
jgi:prepilin-type processing-associated H-X9-DG protein